MIIDTSLDVSYSPNGIGRGRPIARYPLLLAASLLYLVALGLAWSIMRWQGERWWIATFLLFAPRWPLALPLLPLFAWAAWRRAWGHAPILVAAALLLAFGLLGVRCNLPWGDRGEPVLKLLSCNVHAKQIDPGELYALIAREKPDVVALQDWTSANDAVFAPLDADASTWHRRREGELYVASRFEIGRTIPLSFPDTPGAPKAERGAAAAFELLTPSGPVWLVNIHLASPHSGLLTYAEDGGAGLDANTDRRWGQSEQTLGLVETLPGPVVIAGDFNTTDDSPMFLEHWASYPDAFSELGFGIGYTYIVDHTQLRIDHVLGNDLVRFTGFRLGQRIGSPHRPLLVEMRFETGAPELANAEIAPAFEESPQGEAPTRR